MVNNKIAQRAVAAGLSGLMAFGAAAPAALATSWKDFDFYKTSDADDGTYWKRLGGKDRYETMKKIVEAYNETETNFGFSLLSGRTSTSVWNYHSTAVLASGDNFPDALAANGLAGYLTNEWLTSGHVDNSNMSVPVILTKAGSLSAEAKDLLKEMQVQNVIIMGGTAAVSQDVEDAIAKMGIGTSRVAGADRQETSLKALQRINGNWKGRKGTYDLIIATGDNYADALSISPYAYRMGVPVILTKKDGTLTDAQVEAIKANDEIKEIVIVGGTSAVSDSVMGQIGTLKNNRIGVHYTRLAGADRYETSAKIAEFEANSWYDYYYKSFADYYNKYKGSIWELLGIDNGFSFDHAIVATGENFPDALAGGQLAGGWGADEFFTNAADGVDVKDFKLWSPCPLLLVKNGDTNAERVIETQMRANRVNSRTDTYGDFYTWTSKVGELYGWDVIFDKKFDQNLYGAFFWNKQQNGFDMRESAYPFYVSLQSLADLSTKAATSYPRVYDSFTYEAKNLGGTSSSTAPNIDIISASPYIDTTKPVTWTVDGNGNVTFTVQLKATPKSFENADGTGEISTIDILVPATENPLEVGTHTATLRDKVAKVVDSTTGKTQEVECDKHYIKAETKAGLIKWNDVIRVVNKSTDFYGIILGGTSAVSNDKRDDLDDAVRRASGNENESLYNTIDIADDWGVNLTYSRIEYVGSVSKNNGDVTYIGIDGKEAVAAAGEVKGDVYDVMATDGYIVRVRDKNTNYVLGYVYYSATDPYTNYWTK